MKNKEDNSFKLSDKLEEIKETTNALILPEYKRYRLNLMQAKFCMFYCLGNTGAQAALLAGYSKPTRYQKSYLLLKTQKIRDYIKYIQDNTSIEYGITKNMLIEDLVKIKNESMTKSKYGAALTAIKMLSDVLGMNSSEDPNKRISDAINIRFEEITLPKDKPADFKQLAENNIMVDPDLIELEKSKIEGINSYLDNREKSIEKINKITDKSLDTKLEKKLDDGELSTGFD
jgi:hypothetical protein